MWMFLLRHITWKVCWHWKRTYSKSGGKECQVFDQFLNKASELLAKGESFAVAEVVRYLSPISGKVGDKAIVFADGTVWGWIGGGCAQPLVVKEALKALKDGRPRLVRISPSSSQEEGVVAYNMTCHSSGTLDIYIEPVLPKPQIVILGRSKVGQTLAKLGKTILYTVCVAAPHADRDSYPDADHFQTNLNLGGMNIGPQTFIVVSTQGECDEEALEQALQTGASYVAFVASKVKAAKVLQFLSQRGIGAERRSQVHAPAGLNIQARSQEEIAVSILAEIVQSNRSRAMEYNDTPLLPVEKQEVKDPICGMTVGVDAAKYKSEIDGKWLYFCCAACKQTFDSQPDKYMLANLPK
jgi:xanthine dehydrogenase accessory factor